MPSRYFSALVGLLLFSACSTSSIHRQLASGATAGQVPTAVGNSYDTDAARTTFTSGFPSQFLTLTSDEKSALCNYMWNDAWDLNAYLRGTPSSDPTKYAAMSALIDSAMSKFTLPGNAVLYRGALAATEALKEKLVPAIHTYWSDPGFLSTSLSQDIVQTEYLRTSQPNQTKIFYTINAPAGAHGIFIDAVSLSGANDKMGQEWEILLPRNSKLWIENVTTDSQGVINIQANLITTGASDPSGNN